LICRDCGYLEFPGCNRHALLSFRGADGTMECIISGCSTTSENWRKCRLCSGPELRLFCWRLRCEEAIYASHSIQLDLVRTALLVCPTCKAFEFPGTRNGLVKVSGERRLITLPTRSKTPGRRSRTMTSTAMSPNSFDSFRLLVGAVAARRKRRRRRRRKPRLAET